LTKRFGTVTAVHDLSFEVAAGAVTGFIGANRTGKSRTVRMILGLDRPTAGRALVSGMEFARRAEPQARRARADLPRADLDPGAGGITPHTAASDTFDFPRDPAIGSAISSEFIKLTCLPRQGALRLGAIGAAALMPVVFYLSLPVTQGRSLAELRPGELLGAGMLGVDPSLILTGAGTQLALGSIVMPVLYAVIAASTAFVCCTALGIAIPLAVMAVSILAWLGVGTGAAA
jgi:energy-coupling factor transporter ATP-binding protein EcfA2